MTPSKRDKFNAALSLKGITLNTWAGKHKTQAPRVSNILSIYKEGTEFNRIAKAIDKEIEEAGL